MRLQPSTRSRAGRAGENTAWNKVHVPISYSVSSNIPGAMDVCHFASVDPK